MLVFGIGCGLPAYCLAVVLISVCFDFGVFVVFVLAYVLLL